MFVLIMCLKFFSGYNKILVGGIFEGALPRMPPRRYGLGHTCISVASKKITVDT